MRPKFFTYLVTILVITTTIYPPSLFSSGIIVDPRSGTVTLDNAQNGVRVINIAAPNSRGMSHNRFNDFNVDKNGVILNNSNKEGISVLGGALIKNPNLNGKEGASLILNEVTGVNRSNVNGYTEVFGKNANYVLANPNGITCNGCGFINVNRATLSTGRPEIENGFLKNLNVEGGDVTIGTGGLNAENVNYFEIISRTAKLQDQINANDLSIVTGRNDYDYESKQASAKSDAASKPELSIDASSLGSIYAGRIKLISTEAGVGVNVPNDIYADAGDVIIDSNGDIRYKNLTAKGKVDIKSTERVSAEGNTASTSDININAGELDIAQGASLLSHGDIALEAENINNAGSVTSAGTFNLRGFSLINSGELLSNGLLSIVSEQGINDGLILSGSELFINSVSFINNAELTASNEMEISFAQFDNSGVLLAGNLIAITGNEFNNSLTGELISYKDLNVQAQDLNNSGAISSAELLNIDTNTVENQGSLISEQDILFNTGSLINSGDILSNNSFTFNGTTLNNTGSILSAGVDIDSSINNSNIIEGDYIWLKGNILNTGKVNGWSLLDIETTSLNNTNGELLAGVLTKVDGKYTDIESFGDLNLNYNGALTLEGKYFATGDMNISATSIDNRTKLTSLYGLNINTGSLVNQYGTMMAGVNNHPEFTFNTYGTLDINATNITNKNLMYATGLVDIDVTGTLNNYNVIFSKDAMDIYAGTKILNTDNSYIYSIGNMNLATASNGNIDNNLGVIKTEYGNMNINTGTFYNRSTLVGKPHPFFPGWIPGTFDYLTFTEYQGDWLLPNDENVYNYWSYGYASALSDDQWTYFSDGEYNSNAEVIEFGSSWEEMGHRYVYSNLTTSDYSVLRSGGNLIMNLGTLYNSSSDILAAGNITINASNKIDNSRAGYTVNNLPKLSVRIQDGADAGGRFKFFYVQRDYANLLNGNFSAETMWFADSCGFWGTCEHLDSYQFLLDNYIDIKIEYTSQRVSSDRASRIIAGGNVSLNKTHIGEDAPKKYTASSNIFYTDVSGTTNQNYGVNTSMSGLNAGLNGLSLADRRIDVDGVFFRYVSGANYLIESNPLFVDLNGLMSSNYFLERAGYNKDEFNRLFMGDAYWEKEYIAKQIEQEFNRKFIFDEIDSDAMQRELLLTNAADIAGDLKLKIGLGLTEEQRKALKQPIVWYVEQEQVVNGKKVIALVPKVYSPISSDFTVQLAGGVLSGKNIDINTDTDVQVGGIMYADGTTSVKARDFNLDTAQLKTGKLNVNLDRDLNIRASNIDVLGSAILNTKGSINIDGIYKNQRSLTETEDGSSLLTKSTNYIGSKLNIGKDLLVMAGNNFGLMGSDINVGGSAQFDVKGDMVLASAEEMAASERTKFERGAWSSTLTKENHYATTQKAANLNVGNNLTINTDKSLTLIASDITADNVYVEAKGDVNLLSKMDQTTDEFSTVKTGMLSKKIDEVTDYTGTNVGSSIKANNTNYVKADGNVNLVASELASENGTLAIEANDVNLLSANDVIGHSEYHKSISYFSLGSIFGSLGSFMTGGDLEFGSFKEETVVTSEEIAKGSSIRGPTLFVKTKNDMNVMGSDIIGNNVRLDIGRDLVLAPTEQLSSAEKELKEGKLYISAGISGISSLSLEGGLKYTQQNDSQKSVINRGSTINAGNLVINTGNDFINYGSEIASTGDIELNIGRDQKNYDVKDTFESKSDTMQVRTGVKLTLTANPLAFAEGVAGLGSMVGSGFSGIGSINGVFSTANEIMDNATKIGKLRTKDEKGNLQLMSSSGLSYFMDVNKTTTESSSTISKGSNISAGGKLTANIGRDALLYGSNMSGQEVELTVGRNFEAVSVFDTSNDKTTSMSMSMDIGLIGASAGSNNIYGSYNQSSSDKKWLNNQAGITSNGKLTLKVGGNTNLEGSLLASNTGDMDFTTGSLTYSDLTGYEHGSTYGVGRGFDVGLNKNSTSLQYGSVDKEQTVRATIGAGNITVGDGNSLANLNRDLSKAVEITKDEKIDIDITVDDRLLTSEGRAQIGDDLRKAVTTLDDTAKSVGNVLSGDLSVGRAIDRFEFDVNREDVMDKMATNQGDGTPGSQEEAKKDRDAARILANQSDYTAEEKRLAAERFYQNLAIETGTEPSEARKLVLNVYIDEDGKQGFYVKSGDEKGNIYVNAGANNLGSDGFVNAMGHEMVHSVDSNTDPADRENFAKVVGEGTWDALDNGLYMSRADYGMETTTYNPNFADNVVMTLNSYKAGMIAESDKENLWDGSPTDMRFDLLTMTNGLSYYDQNREAIDEGMRQGAISTSLGAAMIIVPASAPRLMPYLITSMGLYGVYQEIQPPSNVGNNSGAIESSYLPEALLLTSQGAKGIADDIARARKVGVGSGGGQLNIGKVKDLSKSNGWKEGDYILNLPDQGTPKANWQQNSSRLRQEMNNNKPIKDVSMNTYDSSIDLGSPRDPLRNSFTGMERNMLNYKGWVPDPKTGQWFPPTK